jgi:disulfide bond formation protein DsbB
MSDTKWRLLFLAWMVALTATLGSLFFSQIMMLPPCSLCWFQRICMYPLVILLLTGLVSFEESVLKYSLPLSGIGWGIALYHHLLYAKILPENVSPCLQGVSCTTVQINWFGFVTIPLLSLTAFSLIIGLLIVLKMRFHEKT